MGKILLTSALALVGLISLGIVMQAKPNQNDVPDPSVAVLAQLGLAQVTSGQVAVNVNAAAFNKIFAELNALPNEARTVRFQMSECRCPLGSGSETIRLGPFSQRVDWAVGIDGNRFSSKLNLQQIQPGWHNEGLQLMVPFKLESQAQVRLQASVGSTSVGTNGSISDQLQLLVKVATDGEQGPRLQLHQGQEREVNLRLSADLGLFGTHGFDQKIKLPAGVWYQTPPPQVFANKRVLAFNLDQQTFRKTYDAHLQPQAIHLDQKGLQMIYQASVFWHEAVPQ